MRYLFLLMLSCTLLFSCGTDSKPASGKAKTAVRAKKTKSKKTKAAKSKKSKAKYWANMKKNVGVSDAQIASIKQIKKKYATQTQQLKKSKKWDGKSNAVNRKKISTNQKAEIKKLIGPTKWAKWEAANKKKKKKKSKKK